MPGSCRRLLRRGGARRWPGCLAAPALPRRVENVLLADPAADTGSRDRAQVDVVLRGELPDQRRHVRALGAVRRRQRLGLGISRLVRRRRRVGKGRRRFRVRGLVRRSGPSLGRRRCRGRRGRLLVAARSRGIRLVGGRLLLRRRARLGVGRGSLVAGPRVWSPLIGRLLVRGLRRRLLEAGRLVGRLPRSGRGLPVAVLRLIGLSGLCGLSAGRGGLGGRGGAILVDDSELGADLDCLVFGDRDPAQYPGDR